MCILPKVIYRFNTTKFNDIFQKIEKEILKFVWNQERAETAKPIVIKKNKAKGITLPDFKIYFQALVLNIKNRTQ
jgi:hypothetical protein